MKGYSKILVTGGAGFIGSPLVDELMRRCGAALDALRNEGFVLGEGVLRLGVLLRLLCSRRFGVLLQIFFPYVFN